MNAECKLMNERGKTIAMGSRDQMTRYLKHHVEDGMYAIEGPGINMTYYRVNGIVYPCGGTEDGAKMPPRSLEECKQVFEECRKTVAETTELELLRLVQNEIHRIVKKGNGPLLLAFVDPPVMATPVEFTLAIQVGENEGIKQIIRLGEFRLVPELVQRLQEFHLPLWGRVAPLLYALHDFSSNMEGYQE